MSNYAANPLETAPVHRLILQYSVPTALTLMVSYIYNIVDQIFVGQGVGIGGMAAVNVAFPLTILTNALALMLGDGCAAKISLSLGGKNQDEADRALSGTVTILLTCGLAMGLLCGLLAPWIVRLFGSTDSAYADAVAYMRVIAWGIPFQMLGPALTAVIRADGRPRYSMCCMIAGASINLILDPIFIFPLNMGVTGAGIATVIGQTASGLLFLRYLTRPQTVHLRRAYMVPTWGPSIQILALGFPSLLTQTMTALVQIVMNNLMRIYGASSVYGSDTALSVYGMIVKVYQISHSMFVGVSSATQPINGYNYGAKHFRRVRETYTLAAKIALAVSAGWFIIFQVFPRQIGGLFVAENALYTSCAAHCFRLYMAAFFLYGLHMTTASFFQATGNPGKALLIPLARQGVFMIPLALLLSARYGLDGALAAAPIADTASFLLSVYLVWTEFRKWERKGLLKA